MSELSLQDNAAEKTQSRNPLRRFYNWVLGWAESRYGVLALFIVAFAESSFFPIPPDALLIPLCLGRRKKALKFALVCTVGSVLGALFGYFLGWALYEPVAEPAIRWFGLTAQFEHVQGLYHEYAGLAVGAAALTPLPYKLFTIGAGLCGINLFVFILASVIFRGLRFFAEALFLWKFGERIRNFIERYFWLATLIFFVLLVGGFMIIKYAAGTPGDNPPASAPVKMEKNNE